VGKPSNCLRSSIINVCEEELEASVKYKKHVYFNLDVLLRMFYNDFLWLQRKITIHYSGDNLETPQRVTDIKNMCREILDGERKPTLSNGNNGGMDMMVEDKGGRINFSSLSGMK